MPTTKPQLWSDLTELSTPIPVGHSAVSPLSAVILSFGLISGGGLDSQDKPDASAADRARPRLAALRQAAFGLPSPHPHEAAHFPTLPLATGHQGEPGRNAAAALPEVKAWKRCL